MRFVTESDASAEVAERLSPLFHLTAEVQMKHFDGSRCRIDYIAIARKHVEPGHRFQMIGLEVKVGYDGIGGFVRALKQCIDYRHSYITDQRSRNHQAAIPAFVFLWPDWTDGRKSLGWNKDYTDSAYAGAVRLAGQYNVGVIRDTAISTYSWQPGTPRRQLEFRVSDTPIWRSFHGSCGDAAFGTARKRGAA